MTTEPGLDGPLISALVGTRRFFTKAVVSQDRRTIDYQGGRQWVTLLPRPLGPRRRRPQHARRELHRFVQLEGLRQDGVITWESQQTDYPAQARQAEYEPRGCPGWARPLLVHLLPTRVRYPYVRGVLLEMYRAAKAEHPDPVDAWASIVTDPEKARAYKSVRGKEAWSGRRGPRSRNSSPRHTSTRSRRMAPTGSPASPHPRDVPGLLCLRRPLNELIGAPMLSFYDWYADLPNASPQMFGDQTDVPESGDWWDAGYLIMWGSNVPLTRTPDAHWMTEARYRGQKVIAVAPDYAENVKFADEWVTTAPGTDGALAMAMGHVLLKEYFVDRSIDFFTDYNQRFTDVPFLITLEDNGSGAYRRASSSWRGCRRSRPGVLGERDVEADGHGRRDGRGRRPNGSIGYRYGEEGWASGISTSVTSPHA